LAEGGANTIHRLFNYLDAIWVDEELALQALSPASMDGLLKVYLTTAGNAGDSNGGQIYFHPLSPSSDLFEEVVPTR
jgi:hypothetical protein